MAATAGWLLHEGPSLPSLCAHSRDQGPGNLSPAGAPPWLETRLTYVTDQKENEDFSN